MNDYLLVFFCTSIIEHVAILHSNRNNRMSRISKMVYLFTTLLTILLGNRLISKKLGVYGTNLQPVNRITFGPPVRFFNEKEAFIMPSTANHSIQRRYLRGSPCKIPTFYDTQLDCSKSLYGLKCNQTCVWGHTFLDGTIQHKMECLFKEEEWTAPFGRCWPFVDCTFHVTADAYGKAECWDHYMDKGPECQMECLEYPYISGVPSALYKCNMDGTWTPKLPYCFKRGPGYNLVPPPKGPKYIAEI